MPQVALGGDCPDYANLGTTSATAETRLTEAEALYPQIYDKLSELPEIDTWLIDGVSCLTEPASVSLAARYHRFRALRADPLGGLGDTVRERAIASLGAAHRLEPAHQSTLPDDHGHYSAHPIEEAGVDAPAPTVGSLYFDGTETLRRPTATATFFQRVDGEGQIVDSAYLFPADPLPDYARPLDSVATLQDRSSKKGLRVAGVGVGLAAIGLGAANIAVRNQALNGTEENARAKQGLVNGLAVSSWVTGAGSVGLLTTSFVIP